MNNTDTYQINSYFAALNAIKPSSLNSLLNKLAGGELVSTGKNCSWNQIADTNLLALVHYDDKNRKIVTQLDRIESGHSDIDKDIGQHDIINYGGKIKNKVNKSKKKTNKSRSRSSSRSRSRSRSRSNSRSGSTREKKKSTLSKTGKKIFGTKKQNDDNYYKSKTLRNTKKNRKIISSSDEYI